MTAINDLTKLTKDFLKLNKAAVRSLKAKDKIYLPDEKGQVDLNSLFASDNTNDNNNNNSDDTGNGTIPDSGVNIDPGKSLSGVEQLWTGTTSITSDTEITLSKEISAIGDGIQLQLQIIKTPITDGNPSSTVVLPIVASNNAKPQAGKYVASVPIPISILAKNLVVGQTINCAIDGIGEALATTKVSQSPVLSIYVKDSKTLVITSHEGYALDKTSAGNTGAFYTGQITSANSFTKVATIPQLPNGTVLYSGVATVSSQITLNKVNEDLTNVGSGIKVYLQDPSKLISIHGTGTPGGTVSLENLKLTVSNPLVFPRDKLMVGAQLATIESNLKHEHIVVNMDNNNPDTVSTETEFNQSKLKYFTIKMILSLQKNKILSYTAKATYEDNTEGSCNHFLTLRPTDQTGDYKDLFSILPITKIVTYTE